MFYRHWNKIALALTGFFWASCDTDTTSANNVDESVPNSSATPTSSATTGTSSQVENSSSSGAVEPLSSSSLRVEVVPLYGVKYEEFVSSSSMQEVMPAYGVSNKVLCAEDTSAKKYNATFTNTVLKCENGVTCEEKTTITGTTGLPCSEFEEPNGEITSICPDYGVVNITEKTYTCTDGSTYNEAEFQMLYEKVTKEEPSDTLFTEIRVLYGTPESFKNMEDQKN